MNYKMKFKNIDPQCELVFWHCRPRAAVKLTQEDCARATEKISVGCVDPLALKSPTRSD